jgi:amino acid transporter
VNDKTRVTDGAPPVDSEHHEAAGLERSHLRAGQITALALASQTPAVALATVPFLLFVTAGNGSWLGALIAATATACVGISVIAFARRYVVTGSLYSYMAQVFGPWARLLVGTTLLLGYVTLIAGVLLLTGAYAGSFLNSVGVGQGLGPGLMTVLTSVALLVATVLAYRGLDASVRSAVVLVLLTLPLVVVITVASAMSTGLHLGSQLSLEGVTPSGVFQGVAAGAVFLVAFESSAALAAETKDPKRNVPLAVMSIPVVLGISYLLATVLQVPGLMRASDAINAGASPAAALALDAGLGKPVSTATDLVLAVANIASLIAFLNYGSRFVATLSTDGLLPARIARIHPRFKSPGRAILALAVLAQTCLLSLVWLYPDDLLTKVFPALSTLTVYMWVVPWVLTCVGATVLAYRHNVAPLRIGLTAAAGAAAMAWIYVNGLVNRPASPVDAMSYVFLILTVLGFVGFLAVERTRRHHRKGPQQSTS